ncbi:unnamed protein product [Caretta caretta]
MAKEKPRKALQELLQRPGNQLCADCSAPDPDWASHTLGVFICLNCSGIHRNIPQVSKVKSVRLDSWDDAQVEFMATNGNNVAKARYESKIPPFYYKPTFPDCQLLREQWIRAKYERKEFIYTEKQEPYSAGARPRGVPSYIHIFQLPGFDSPPPHTHTTLGWFHCFRRTIVNGYMSPIDCRVRSQFKFRWRRKISKTAIKCFSDLLWILN